MRTALQVIGAFGMLVCASGIDETPVANTIALVIFMAIAAIGTMKPTV